MKLVESLISGELAAPPPTQIKGQESSVVPPGKGQEVKGGDAKEAAKGQKNPTDPKDPDDQQRGGLVAMMTAGMPITKAKPTLSLNFGRAAGEDSFVKSAKSEPEEATSYIPDAVPQPAVVSAFAPAAIPPDEEADKPKAIEALPEPAPVAIQPPTATSVVPMPLPVSIPIPKDVPVKERQSAGDRPRPTLDVSSNPRQAPTLPPVLGKIRPAGPPSSDPIAFAAQLTGREEPQAAEAPEPPDTPQSAKLAPAPQNIEPEIVPTNPKPDSRAAAPSQAPSPETSKSKPIPPERTAENVPTNPKPQTAFAAPAREIPAQSAPGSAKTAPAGDVKQDVKQSAPAQETELQTKPTIRSEPAREISIRIPSGDNGNVDVQIVERNGKVQVTVRGSDAQLNTALRSDLTELVHTLDQKGYKTETWTPSDTYPTASSSTPEVQSSARSESSQDWSGNQPNDGGNGGGSGGNQQQRRQQQERPDWLIELERRLETEG